MRDAAFARAEECVRDSKFVVCGEVQKAFTVVSSLLSQQKVVRAVDIISVYDACHGASYPIVCLFRKS